MTQLSAKQVNGMRLAAWIYKNHPTLFNALVAKARAAAAAKSKIANISGLGCVSCDGAPSVKGFGALGQGFFSSIGSDLSGMLGSSSGSSSSGGFWSGLGSDLSSLGSDVTSGISDVGSYLTTGGGLSSLTSLANTYFAGKAVATQANMQQAVLNAQTQRVASGYSPAPVAYSTNSAGQTVPYLATSSGYSPLTTQGIASLSSTGIPSWLPWAAAGAVGVFLLLKVI